MDNRRPPRDVTTLARRLASGFIAAALLLVLAGCGPGPLVSPYPGTPTDAQRETLQKMERRMAEVRELEPLREVEYAFVPRGSMNQVVSKYLNSGYRGMDDLDTEYSTQPVYRLLGFMPWGADLIEQRMRLSATAAAFYDPSWYTVVLQDQPQTLDASYEAILAHEFVHALQYQHFNLYELATRDGNDWDAGFALRALMEGDATVAMRQYSPMSADRSVGGVAIAIAESIYGSFPDAIKKEFAFPYEAGVTFVEALLGEGGWAAVNDAYGRLPTTTEQVLHPEKYLAGETGKEIILGHVLEPFGGRLWFRSNGGLGEFLLRTHLEEHLGQPEAAAAAAGWGGDRWSLYTDEERGELLHLVIEWDTVEDLDEFFAAYLSWLEAASGGTSEVVGADAALWHGDERSIYVSRGDGRITILISTDRAAFEEARKALQLP